VRKKNGGSHSGFSDKSTDFKDGRSCSAAGVSVNAFFCSDRDVKDVNEAKESGRDRSEFDDRESVWR
jgi:hypothetical protein